MTKATARMIPATVMGRAIATTPAAVTVTTAATVMTEDDTAYEYNSAQGSDTHGSDDSSADSSSDDSDSSSDDGSDSSADEVGEAHTAHKALHVATLQPAPQPAVAPTPEAKSISGEPPRPVLPGHGKIATHKRNARRRSAHRWKAAALGLCSPPTKARQATMPHDSQDLATSIATKKAALLKNLNLEGETSLPAGVPDNEKQDASTPSRAPGVVPTIRPRLPQDPLAPPTSKISRHHTIPRAGETRSCTVRWSVARKESSSANHHSRSFNAGIRSSNISVVATSVAVDQNESNATRMHSRGRRPVQRQKEAAWCSRMTTGRIPTSVTTVPMAATTRWPTTTRRCLSTTTMASERRKNRFNRRNNPSINQPMT